MRNKIYGPLAKLQCSSLSHGSKTKFHPQKMSFPGSEVNSRRILCTGNSPRLTYAEYSQSAAWGVLKQSSVPVYLCFYTWLTGINYSNRTEPKLTILFECRYEFLVLFLRGILPSPLYLIFYVPSHCCKRRSFSPGTLCPVQSSQ